MNLRHRNFMSVQPPLMRAICSMPEGDPPGGGGGEGDAFTPAQTEALNKMINSANSTHATRQEKRFDTKLEEMQTGITSAMTEGFSKFGKKEDPPPPKKQPGESEAMASMRQEHEARMKEMENKFSAEQGLRVEEASKAKVTEERSRLTAALSKQGVPPGLLKGAAAQLYVEDKVIGRSKEDGQVIFKMQRDGFHDELSLEKGIEEWLGTEEGKNYAPARGAGGSGATGGKARTPNNKLSKAQAKHRAKHELMAAIIRGE